MNPVPIGIPGEICLSGAGLSRGYLQNAMLTAERFVPHPFKEGERLYRTGDIGRWLSDGNIEFLGKKEDQGKIRGHRIELAEIENSLLKLDTVKETVVIFKDFNGDGKKELAAYLTGNKELDISLLRECLKKMLPDYIIPSYFVQVERIPLTSNGETDLNALPDPLETGMDPGNEYVSPRDTLELQLSRLYEDILNVRSVGINDNFFEHGGNSLSAIRLVSEIERLFGKKISLSLVCQYSTIKQLSGFLQKIDNQRSLVCYA